MSIEFEELEEPLSLLGSMIVAISSFILLLLASLMGFPILSGSEISYVNWQGETVSFSSLSIGYTFFSFLS